VGTDFTLHLCNLSVLSTALRRVISATINHFLGARGCDVLLIGPLSGPSARIDEIAEVARDQHDPVQRVDALGDTCTTYFHLPASFDEYLNSLSKQQRYNFTRKMTHLSKAHKVRCDVVSAPDEVMAEFEAFRELHETQWRREGKLGHFGDWPRGEDFNRQLVRTLGPRGMVRFHRIMADAEVVSSQFSFPFGGTTYWRLPARASATEWDRFSFGWLGLAKLFEASIQEGRCIVEGGRGHYAYKLQLGGREWPLRTLQVVRRGRGVAERLRAFRFFARQLDIAYYKIVFARLAPRMPLLRRRLWPLWIRSTW
jgi:CelD/BcsL family acetyltransferase involved in cellulose biosynthesis